MNNSTPTPWSENELTLFFQYWKRYGQLTNFAQFPNRSQEEVECVFNKHKSLLSLAQCNLEVFLAASRDMEISSNSTSQDPSNPIAEKQSPDASLSRMHQEVPENEFIYPIISTHEKADKTITDFDEPPSKIPNYNSNLELTNNSGNPIRGSSKIDANGSFSTKDFPVGESNNTVIDALDSKMHFTLAEDNPPPLKKSQFNEKTQYDESRAVSLFCNFVSTVSEHKLQSSKYSDTRNPDGLRQFSKSNSLYQILLKALNPKFQSPTGGLIFWAICEFFYPFIEWGWYAQNEFLGYLYALRLFDIRVATRHQWNVIRKMMGGPRRFSQAFLRSERAKLRHYRNSIKQNSTINYMIPFNDPKKFNILSNGEPCLILESNFDHLNITPGFVENYNSKNGTYKVRVNGNIVETSEELIMSRDYSRYFLCNLENPLNFYTMYDKVSPLSPFENNEYYHYDLQNSSKDGKFENSREIKEIEQVYYLKILMNEQTKLLDFLSEINCKAEIAKSENPNADMRQLFSIDQQKSYASTIKVLSVLSEVISENIKTLILRKETKV